MGAHKRFDYTQRKAHRQEACIYGDYGCTFFSDILDDRIVLA